MILTIARKELKSLFASPLAWVVLTLVQLVLAFAFLKRLDDFMQLQAQLLQVPNPPGVTELVAASVYSTFAIVMLFAVPLLAMRLIAEERRNRTMVLLVSAPISTSEIVLGKFLGLVAFLTLIIAVTSLMPLSLLLGGKLDWGLLASLTLGCVLLAASFTAVCLYASCLTVHPLAAAMGGFCLLLGMLLVGETAADGLQGRGWQVPAAFAQVLSPLKNFEAFSKGVIDSYSLVCLLLLTIAFLLLAIRELDSARLTG
jgi:ABC-2 type transport system permease protein